MNFSFTMISVYQSLSDGKFQVQEARASVPADLIEGTLFRLRK